MPSKTKTKETTAIVRAGFAAQGTPNPYLHSSANWLLYAFGQMLNASGRTLPSEAWNSRGHSVATDLGSVYQYDYKTEHFTRLS